MSEEEILRVVRRVFETGKEGNLETFRQLHSTHYTRFSDLPPYRIQEKDEALKLKGSLYSELVDFTYQMSDIEVKVLGDVAVVTFLLKYGGVYVYGYTFEGRPLSITSRCTVVLVREDGEWRIIHEHYSRIPEQE